MQDCEGRSFVLFIFLPYLLDKEYVLSKWFLVTTKWMNDQTGDLLLGNAEVVL
jgi:hypothetical protein